MLILCLQFKFYPGPLSPIAHRFQSEGTGEDFFGRLANLTKLEAQLAMNFDGSLECGFGGVDIREGLHQPHPAMSRGPRFPVWILLLTGSVLCGCPGPRPPLETAQPPVEGTRSNTNQAASSTTATSDEWFRWRGPELTGISPDKSWNAQFPPEGPKQLWKQNVGTGFSSISVANGRVYTMGHESRQDTVFCFDLESGKEIWKHS